MIKLVDILNETGESLIGPFYHETSKEGAKEILKHGLVPEQHGNSYAMNSLSPAKTSGMHGDVSLQIWLRPWQFEQAMEDTYKQIVQDLHHYDPKEIELLELLLDGNMEEEDYQELVKRATTDPEFLAGEIVFRGTIGPEQIKIPERLNEIGEVSNPYDWDLAEMDEEGGYYTFDTPENKYVVAFVELGGNTYDVSFNTAGGIVRKTIKLDTNENVALRVLSTVTEIALDFIKRANPEELVIHPIKTKEDSKEDLRRFKIYGVYLRKNLPNNYKLYTMGDSYRVIKN